MLYLKKTAYIYIYKLKYYSLIVKKSLSKIITLNLKLCEKSERILISQRSIEARIRGIEEKLNNESNSYDEQFVNVIK